MKSVIGKKFTDNGLISRSYVETGKIFLFFESAGDMEGSCLLVVDMQEGFRYPSVVGLVPVINKLITAFSDHVIYAQFVDLPGSTFQHQLQRDKFQYIENQQFLREMEVSPSAYIIQHTGYVIFTQLLRRYLEAHQIDNVYLCGIYTDVCITHTALSLRDAGIHPYIVTDAMISQNKEDYPAVLASLTRSLGSQHMITSQSMK